MSSTLMTTIKNSPLLKGMLALKAGLLVTALFSLDSGFYLGDRTSRAAEEPKKELEKPPAAAPAEPAKAGAEAGEKKNAATPKEEDKDKETASAEPSKESAAAQPPPASEEKTENASAATGKEENKAPPKADVAPIPDPPKEQKRSFLDELLNLPALAPDVLKKDEIGKYLALAERKKSQADERINFLKKREDQLVKLEKSIEDKLSRLDEERRFFAQTIQKEKDLQGERLEKLITLYAKMEPKKAAPVIEAMNKDLVVALFKALPQKQITKILEAMTPEKSVELSEYYGRVRSMREYDLLKEMNQSLREAFQDCKVLPSSAPSETAVEKGTKA